MSDFNLTKFLEQYAKPNAFGQVGWKQPTREAAKQDMEEWRRQQLEAADPPLQDHLAATAADVSVLTPHGAILQMLAPIAAKRNLEGLRESFDIAKMLIDPFGGGAMPLHGDGLAAAAWARKGVPREVALSRAASGAAHEAETASQLLHRLINDRNTVYHATGVEEAKSILNAGAILPNPWLHQGMGKTKQKQLMKEVALAKIQAGKQPSTPAKPTANPSASEFTKVENPSWMYDVHEEKNTWSGATSYYSYVPGVHHIKEPTKEAALAATKDYVDKNVITYKHPDGTEMSMFTPVDNAFVAGKIKTPDGVTYNSVSLPKHFSHEQQMQFLIDMAHDTKNHKVKWTHYEEPYVPADKQYTLTDANNMVHPEYIKETSDNKYYIDSSSPDVANIKSATDNKYYSSLGEAQAAFKKQNKNWNKPDAWYKNSNNQSTNPTVGVSVSRIARIKPKESRAVSFVIDNEKMPPARPLAEVGFRKLIEESYGKDEAYSKAYDAWINDLTKAKYDIEDKIKTQLNVNNADDVYYTWVQQPKVAHAFADWIQDLNVAKQQLYDKYKKMSNLSSYEDHFSVLDEYDKAKLAHQKAVKTYGAMGIPAEYLNKHNAPPLDPIVHEYKQAIDNLTKANAASMYDVPKQYIDNITKVPLPMNKHFEYEDRTYNEEIPTSAIKQILIDKNALPKLYGDGDEFISNFNRHASNDAILEEARKMYGNKLPIKIFESSKQMHAERAYKTKDLKELFMKLLQGR